MADLNEIGLNPVARPTEQYVGPNIKRSAKGAEAMQLAGALKGFSKDAEEVYNRRFAAYQQASEAQADRIDAQGVYHNQEQLKAAVARGEIPAHSNPWLMVRLRQNIARGEAMTAAASAHNDLRQNEVFHQDSPELVSQFVDQRMQAVVQGKDSWEVAAMSPEIDKAKHNIMSDWMDTRGQERIRESRSTFGSILRKRTDEWNASTALALQHGDPNAHLALEGMVHDMQEELQAQGAVVDWATANQWFSEAVLQAARDKRSPELAQYILDRINTKAGVLSKTADNRASLERLPREIAELKNADARSEIETRQLESKKQAMDLIEQGGKLMKEQGKGNILDVDVPTTELQQKYPLAWAEYQKMVSTMASDFQQIKNSDYLRKLDPLTAEAYGKAARGELSKPESMKLGGAMALLGEPGRSAAEGLFRFLYHQKSAEYGSTKPTTLADLNKSFLSGTLTVDKVLEEARGLNLDQQDTSTYIKLASQLESSGGASSRQAAPVAESLRQLADLVEHPYLKDGLIGGAGSSQYADQLKDKQQQAEAAFLKEFYLKLVKTPDWDKLPFAEQHKQIEELRDSVAKSFGGPTMADFLKVSRPEAVQQTKPVNIADTPAEPVKPQDKKAGGDPMHLDDQAVSQLSRMFKYPATKPELHELLRPSAQNPEPLGPGVNTGQVALSQMLDYRHRQTFDVTGLPIDTAKRTIGGDDRTFNLQASEAQSWHATMDRLQAMKPGVENSLRIIQQTRDAFAKSGSLTYEQQQSVRTHTLRYLAFQDLRRQLGYTPDEVKDMGEGSWRSAPMFANQLDLYTRGPSVAEKLGVKDVQRAAFFDAQLQLLKQVRNLNRDE